MKELLIKIAKLYWPFKKTIIILFIFMALDQLLIVVSPYIFGKIIDAVITKKSLEYIFALAGTALVVYVFQDVILDYYQEKLVLNRLDFDIQRYTAKKTLKKIMGFSIGQHANENSGIKQSVINKGEYSLKKLAFLTLYQVIPLVFQVGLTIAALVYLSPALGLIVIFFVIILLGLTIYINLALKASLKKHQDLINENSRLHTEILRNIEVVQINAQEERATDEYDQDFKELADFGKVMWSRYALFASLRNLIIGFTVFTIVIIGSYYVHKGFYTPGYLIVFLTWSKNLFGQAGSIGTLHRNLMEMYSAAQKYFILTEIEPEVKTIKNPVSPKQYRGKIEFREVYFAYPVRKYLDEKGDTSQRENCEFTALDNISFAIEPDQKVAFVGHSGAGKSTIVRLLTRAYDPNKGQIIVDNNDLRILDLKHYRQHIGVVEQDVLLFDATLGYNICYGLNGQRAAITKDMLDEVARLACIDQFKYRLESEYDTIIGEKGIKLSGGERQRVGIARALIKNPDILILDEATSHLDTENETLIRQALEQASKGRTTIIIAHRLSTVKDADKIIVLKKGRVVGIGSHQELIGVCDEYKKLIHNQTVTV